MNKNETHFKFTMVEIFFVLIVNLELPGHEWAKENNFIVTTKASKIMLLKWVGGRGGSSCPLSTQVWINTPCFFQILVIVSFFVKLTAERVKDVFPHTILLFHLSKFCRI